MRKKVSCHVITYNQKNYIAQCIEGILMQQVNFSFEIIIGDDNSTDGTRDILQKYAEKFPEIIKLNLRQVRGTGIPGKENFVTTLAMCTGEYISLCDGDDYWTDPLKLQKQVDFLEKNSDYVLCFHQVNILQPNGSIHEDFITIVPDEHETFKDLALSGNYIHTPSVVFRNIIQPLPFEFEYAPIGDYFIYMILAQHGKLKYLKETMAVYRYGVGVYSGAKTLQNIKSNLKLFTLLLSYHTDEEIKKIIWTRQQRAAGVLEDFLKGEEKVLFITKNQWKRIFKKIKKSVG
ncbi:glycosyltransferase [Flavobacterium sp. XGLA_31]|uniref:glycosyltransferase n=1 Tax=Flavobacterium sp. XGLA_31 TaxID=3447666 RepID=UPI003F2BC50D